MAEKKKFEVLFTMLTSIIQYNYVNKDIILNENEMSERTFYRYIDDFKNLFDVELKQNGARYEIKSEDVKSIKKKLQINESMNEEQALTKFFLYEMSKTISLYLDSSTFSMGNIPDYERWSNIISIEQAPISTIPADEDSAKKLLKLTQEMEKVSFIYFKTDESQSYKVNAIPYLLHFSNGRWYLVVEDEKDNIIKKYCVEKIRNIHAPYKKLVGGTNKSKDEIKNHNEKREELKEMLKEKKHIFFSAGRLAHDTVIRFDADVAHYFIYTNFGFSQTHLQTNDNGSIDVQFKFETFEELWFTIVNWVGSFEILSPQIFKDQFLDKAARIYGQAGGFQDNT